MSQLFDRAVLIKQALTVPQVLAHYGYRVSKRMRCPIHGGDGLNFEVKEKTWKCYSQCGNGDVIELVQKLFNISFQEALEKIDGDFGLGLSSERDERKLEAIKKRTEEIEAERAREQDELNRLQAEYDKAYDRWVELDIIIREKAPRNMIYPFEDEWVKAIKAYSLAEYELNKAEMELNRWKLTK